MFALFNILRLCTHSTRITLHTSRLNWHDPKSLLWLDIHSAPYLTIICCISLTVLILMALTIRCKHDLKIVTYVYNISWFLAIYYICENGKKLYESLSQITFWGDHPSDLLLHKHYHNFQTARIILLFRIYILPV